MTHKAARDLIADDRITYNGNVYVVHSNNFTSVRDLDVNVISDAGARETLKLRSDESVELVD